MDNPLKLSTVFQRIDAQTWNIHGVSPFAVLQNVKVWRRYLLLCAIVACGCWAFFGWDSTWSQLQPYGEQLGPLLKGEISFGEVRALSKTYYGIGNHFSAPAIYGFAFVFLSLYLERIGIEKSKNFFVSTSLSLMSIGIYEWTYNLLYANLQNQLWTITFAWKQITNLIYFSLFIAVGVLTLLLLHSEGYRLNLSRVTWALFIVSMGFWFLWVYYPFPITQITVETSTGPWISTNLFPQTMYAVDLSPNDGLAMGHPFFVENDLLHAVNTFGKIFSTGFLLVLFRFRRETKWV